MLILVRHGRTALNAAGRLQGRIDEPLDDVGRRQAASVAARVGTVAELISSPLVRATETAQAFGVPFTIDERWIELSYGEFEGRSIRDSRSPEWERWRTDVDYAPAGGESLVEVDRRVRAACDELVERARDIDVVVVTHVSPIKAAVAWALDASISISWRTHLSPASICRIDVSSGRPVLTSFNETASLPE